MEKGQTFLFCMFKWEKAILIEFRFRETGGTVKNGGCNSRF